MQKCTLSLGHSPDPDDAFMFYALAKELIPTHGFGFEHVLQDIQTLNERALRGELDISAISIHAYAYVSDQYRLLPCGASMGDGYGPVLVAKEKFLKGKADVGLIIHEGQLTYQNEGLQVCEDLGVWWGQENQGLPLPLGANVIHKRIDPAVCKPVSDILEASIRYGLEHRAQAVQHALQYARDMGRELAEKFVGMYVNHWTLDYGERGRQSIRRFLGRAFEQGLIPGQPELEFVG